MQVGKERFDKEAYYMEWKDALEQHSSQLQLKLSAANRELAACMQRQDEQAALRVELASVQVIFFPFFCGSRIGLHNQYCMPEHYRYPSMRL